MTISTPASLQPAGSPGPRTTSPTQTALTQSVASHTRDFLTPTLVSIAVEVGTVAFLMALLLLLVSSRPGDGGEHSGGFGNGTSGQGGTGEFAVTGTGSGTADEESKTTDDAASGSEEVKELSESSGLPQRSGLRPQKPGSPGTLAGEQSNAFTVPDFPKATADPEPQGVGGGNGFSDVGDRLRKAGAKTGDVQISLAWNNGNDLDLHVETPGQEKIWYNQRQSSCGGELDVDMNAGGPASQRPVENVYWPEGGSPSGKFRVLVHHYANHGDRDPTQFQVTIKTKNRTQSFAGSLRSGDPPKMVHEFPFP